MYAWNMYMIYRETGINNVQLVRVMKIVHSLKVMTETLPTSGTQGPVLPCDLCRMTHHQSQVSAET